MAVARWASGLVCLLTLTLLPLMETAAVPFGIPPPNKTQNCHYGVSLEWTARVGSSVYATPVIADLMHDGKKEILLPTFSQYLEALNGANGEDVLGYPFIHPKFKSYASPLPVDIDGDGKVEWLVAMYTGELVLFNEEGKSRGLLKVPPLAVKRRWMDNRTEAGAFSATDLNKVAAMRVKRTPANAAILNDIMRARQMNDLYLFPAVLEADSAANTIRGHDAEGNHVYSPPRQYNSVHARGAQEAAIEPDEFEASTKLEGQGVLRSGGDQPIADAGNSVEGRVDGARHSDEAVRQRWEQAALIDEELDIGGDVDDDMWFDHLAPEMGAIEQQGIGPDGHLSKEAKASMSLLFHPELYRANIVYDEENDAFSTKFLRGQSVISTTPDEILVDAHILSTPRIVDIDGGGDLDIIVHVSYFFDPDEYTSPLFGKKPLAADIDPDNYVATAVVCMNLVTGDLKWMHPLHLGTRRDSSAAYALSSPLVVNAERKDAALEVYVTSSTGSVVGLSSEGALLPGWPVWLGPIAASPTAEDLLGNDELNICVGDIEGKVKCLTSRGDVLWERNVIGGLADHITYGDVNGDGVMDVVFGTTAGLIYALDGTTGNTLPYFPVATRGSIVAPVLLLNLQRRFFFPGIENGGGSQYTGSAKYPPLTLVVPSHDGNVYLVHGRDGCTETIDIDEKASSMVLADDLTGNGHMDLLVTTINGGVYAFETRSEYHPLKAWGSKTKGLNGNSASENNVGVYIAPDYRRPRDVRGDKFRLKIGIEDHRPRALKSREYAISVYVGTRTRVFKGVFTQAKEYSIQVRAPLERLYTSVTVVMTLPNGQVFSDTISLGFNMHFLATIKYVLVIPFVGIACALMFVHKRHEVDMSN